MRVLDVAPGRFSCEGCARCCTMWDVPVTADEAERLRARDWGAPGVDPFVRRFAAGDGPPFRIRRMADGRCFFLDADNRCRIHSQIAYEAKPEACKAFPLSLSDVGSTRHVRLSFWCPTVAADRGAPLDDQMRWVKSVSKNASAIARAAPLALYAERDVSGNDVEAIDGELRRIAEHRSAPAVDRISAGAALLARARAAHGEGRSIRIALADADADVASLAREGRASGRPIEGAEAIGLCLTQDCRPAPSTRLRQVAAVRLFRMGLGSLPSLAIGARASRSAIRKTTLVPQVGDAVLSRWLIQKVRGRRHLSGDLTLIQGWNLLAVAWGTSALLARLRAAAAGRPTCDDADVLAGVQAADLLVLEHSQLLAGSAFGGAITRLLASPTMTASVLAWLAEM